MLDPVNGCQPAQHAATCRRSDTDSKNILVYLQHDSRNERFENMEKGTFQIPGKPLRRIFAKPKVRTVGTRFSSDAVIYGFNDFMTQCRHSPVIRIPASPQNRIRAEPPPFADADITEATATKSA